MRIENASNFFIVSNTIHISCKIDQVEIFDCHIRKREKKYFLFENLL
jgi:hypothetical protein